MLKDIASGVTVCLLLAILAVNLPVIGSLCAFFLPLAVLFFTVKTGPANGWMVPTMAAAGFMMLSGHFTPDALVMAAMMGLGYGLARSVGRDWSIERIVVGACAAALAGATGMVWLYAWLTGQGFVAMIDAQAAKHLEATIALYQAMGIGDDRLQILVDNIEPIRYAVVRLLPAFAVMAAMIVSWLNLLMARPLLTRAKLPSPCWGPLRLWKAPEHLVWLVIVSGLLLLLPGRNPKMIGLNGMLMVMTVYFFQGMAIVAFVFDKKRFPRPLRGILYAMIALQQLLILVIIGAGLFDIWFNFRKLDAPKTHS